MRTISFSITEQHITASPISDLVGNTRNYVKAEFTFSSEWDDMLKVAIFTANSKQYDVIIENGECMVPGIAMSGEYFDVGVCGGADETRLTTDTCRVRVDESVRQKPPYDVVNMYEGLENAISDLRDEDTTLHGEIDGIDTRLTSAEDKIEDLEEVPAIADEALTKAGQAITAAATAQTTADQAVSDAADAQSTADQAVSDAATAQSTADSAVTAAATAQTTANTAVTNAATAQTTADQAVSDAADAQSTADTADGKADTLAARLTAHEGISIASQNGVHNLRYVIATGKLQIYDPQSEQWTDITSGSGGEISVDDVLSTISRNPVQNKVLTVKINEIVAAVEALQSHSTKSITDSSGVHELRKKTSENILQVYDSTNDAWIDITAPTATVNAPGIVQPDGTSITISNGIISTPEPLAQQEASARAQAITAEATARTQAVNNEAELRVQKDFDHYNKLFNESGTITEDQYGNTVISMVDSTNSVSKVTTVEETSPTVDTITEVITPTAGDYYWTRVTVMTETASGITKNVTVTRSNKE